MKISPPPNSKLSLPVCSITGSASAEPKKTKLPLARCTILPITLLAIATLSAVPTTIKADDFELAMVIKETTNPYYNATLQGAQLAAQEKARTQSLPPSSDRALMPGFRVLTGLQVKDRTDAAA